MRPSLLTVGSLFSGLGGLEMGMEQTGRFETVWQVENDDYCLRRLAELWPMATRLTDVRIANRDNLSTVDVIVGGFPCQDISIAGKKAGINGENSGLWQHFSRIIGELRPRYVVVENVAELTRRGLDRVCGDLASFGYDAEWSVVSACAVGAPHTRERVFVVAYPVQSRQAWRGAGWIGGWGVGQTEAGRTRRNRDAETDVFWKTEPSMARVANGVPFQVERINRLGNAVVPQVGRLIGNIVAEIDAQWVYP